MSHRRIGTSGRGTSVKISRGITVSVLLRWFALYFFYNQFMLTCAIDIAVIRTSHLLRRDQMTAYTTILTGPSSNLLAPSFGGSPLSNGTFGGWAALTGVHVYGRWIAGLSLLEGVAGGVVLRPYQYGKSHTDES